MNTNVYCVVGCIICFLVMWGMFVCVDNTNEYFIRDHRTRKQKHISVIQENTYVKPAVEEDVDCQGKFERDWDDQQCYGIREKSLVGRQKNTYKYITVPRGFGNKCMYNGREIRDNEVVYQDCELS